MRIRSGLFTAMACVAALSARAGQQEDEPTSVYAQVFNNYTRSASSAGGYKAETYAFANGGQIKSLTVDNSVDKAVFNQVIQAISPAMTRQNYIAATDPNDTDLLIYVYWGATTGFAGLSSELPTDIMTQAMDVDADWYGAASRIDDSNRRRDLRAFSNAGLLGYREALVRHLSVKDIGVHGTIYHDLYSEVEEPRYFVVMTAFDFKSAWKDKKLVPLWSTRYNIPTRGNNFTAALPDMSMFASRFFGRDSQGLVRRLNPTGKVEMGDIKVLGAVETPAQLK